METKEKEEIADKLKEIMSEISGLIDRINNPNPIPDDKLFDYYG